MNNNQSCKINFKFYNKIINIIQVKNLLTYHQNKAFNNFYNCQKVFFDFLLINSAIKKYIIN